MALCLLSMHIRNPWHLKCIKYLFFCKIRSSIGKTKHNSGFPTLSLVAILNDVIISFKRSVGLLSGQAGSPRPYWTYLMYQIACNKEMPSSHFCITLEALGWPTTREKPILGKKARSSGVKLSPGSTLYAQNDDPNNITQLMWAPFIERGPLNV